MKLVNYAGNFIDVFFQLKYCTFSFEVLIFWYVVLLALKC